MIENLICVDVDYRDSSALAAGVLFHGWEDEFPAREELVHLEHVQAYQPGRFFKRELPCLLRVLDQFAARPDIVIVDGYVWLGPGNEPGLGAFLFESLARKAGVIGVAKRPFCVSDQAVQVFRGKSRLPLYVTGAGLEPDEAAQRIRSMHGRYRIPTLLRRVDRLSRSWRTRSPLRQGH